MVENVSPRAMFESVLSEWVPPPSIRDVSSPEPGTVLVAYDCPPDETEHTDGIENILLAYSQTATIDGIEGVDWLEAWGLDDNICVCQWEVSADWVARVRTGQWDRAQLIERVGETLRVEGTDNEPTRESMNTPPGER